VAEREDLAIDRVHGVEHLLEPELDLGPQGGSVTFEERNSIDPATVVRLMQQAPREYRLEGPLRLRITRVMPTEEARFDFGASLMKRLAGKPR